MAVRKGNLESEAYNLAPVIPGNKKVWFLNGELVRIHHFNKSNGIMYYPREFIFNRRFSKDDNKLCMKDISIEYNCEY